MKNFFTRALSFLLFSIFFVIFSIPELTADSVAITNDTFPKVRFDSISNGYTVVEKMPMFPEGEQELMKFVTENLKYPEKAKELKIEGFVIVQFIVDKSGKIIDPMVVRGIGGGCDQEAQRVVKLMPDWTPGYHNGEPVRVKFTMPIRFKLSTP
ncbi:MAG: energy transducer TonB [Saprospiraceae bacterium]|nr:energy transducer TonB [Saprospiraceae bacterium]